MTQKTRISPLSLLLLLTLFILLAGMMTRPAASSQPPEPRDPAAIRNEIMVAQAKRPGPQPLPPLTYTPCVNGFADVYPCLNVDLLAFIPLSAMTAGSGNDIWGWTDPLDGQEYALMGLDNGTGFVDISDPINPVYLGKLPTHTSSSTWRDIKVYADHAFVVSEASGHGMQVFDLTQLRNVPNPPVTFAETAHYNQFGNAHNIAINGESGYAYAIGTNTCAGGLHIVNIQNPTAPTNAGCFSSDGYTHDTECVNYDGPDTTYVGHEICFSSNEDTLTIVDVTNKSTPVQLSRTGYAGSSYTHQGWLTDDHTYFLLDDEGDESTYGHNTRTRIWDVSDLNGPFIIDYYDGVTPAIDHNLYLHEGYVYESNYRAGVRILDGSDIPNGNLEEVAFFDVYPASNSANFSGTWSNYPYFESGVVIATGMDEGLFVIEPILSPDFRLSAAEDTLATCEAGSDSTAVDLSGRNGYTGSVSLGTTGLPAGTSAAFSLNPVIVPGSSVLTVTVSSAAAGSYPFTLAGTDGVLTHTADLTLNVYDGVPGAATLLTPADGATDVDLAPTFTWSAASQGATYDLEVATDPGFSNVVYTASVEGTSHTATANLEQQTVYYWRVQASNNCGTGGYSAAFSFTTRTVPGILLVDDDDNDPDVRAYYTNALNGLGESYDVWDTSNSDNEPGAVDLEPYHTVLWFTGLEYGGFAGPGLDGETALGDWLDESNCLFISGQDYYYDRGLTSFMSSYLGLASAVSDVSQTTVTGQGSVFGGLGPYSLSYPFANYSDRLTPNATAEIAFSGNAGTAAIDKDTGDYRTTFWGFPFEAIPAASRTTVMGVVVEFCRPDYAANLQASSAMDTLPGTVVIHTFTLENLGLDDSYTLAVSDYDWPTTLLTTSPIAVTGGESAVIEVRVEVPDLLLEIVHDSDDFTLSVTSEATGDNYTAVGTTNSVTNPAVTTSGDMSGVGVLGQTLAYTLTVTNAGDYTDTYTISYGPSAWATAGPSSEGSLAPGASAAVVVEVTIGNGPSDSLTVTFTSGLDNMVTATVTLTSSTRLVYLPYVARP